MSLVISRDVRLVLAVSLGGGLTAFSFAVLRFVGLRFIVKKKPLLPD